MFAKTSKAAILLIAMSGCVVYAQRADYLPLELLEFPKREGGIRLWKFDVYPTASMRSEYNDNITYLPSRGSSDFIWYFTPGFSARAGTAKHLTLGYSPSAQIYTKNSQYNAFNHSANVGLDWPLAKLSLKAQATYEDTLSSDVVVGGMTRGRSFAFTFGAGYELTQKLGWSGNFRYSMRDYGNYSGAYATPAAGLIGYNDWGTDQWLNYKYSDKTAFGVGVSVGNQGAQTGGVNSIYERVMASFNYLVTDKIGITLAIGPEFRQYDGNQSGSVGLSYNLTGRWQPTDRTTITLGASRSQTPSPVLAGENYINTTASIGLNQRIADRYFANIGVSYNNVNSGNSASEVGSGRNDDYIALITGVGANLAYRWTARLFYERRQSISGNNSTYEFDNNRAGFEITWRY
jgi:hypothetical protein